MFQLSEYFNELGIHLYVIGVILLTIIFLYKEIYNTNSIGIIISYGRETEIKKEIKKSETGLKIINPLRPSVGFIGTVRGIGDALSQADKAVQGDIAGVTQSLGVAFNSTFIALLISIFLMFLVHQLQLLQERLVHDTENYCNDRVIRHLKVD